MDGVNLKALLQPWFVFHTFESNEAASHPKEFHETA